MNLLSYTELSLLSLILVFGIGLVILGFGGAWLTRGSAGLALILKVNPVIVGLTIVAVATSMPELITSFIGVYQGSDGLVLGNIIGSNICNIGLILGLSAFVYPLHIQLSLIRREMPILFVVTVFFTVLLLGGALTRIKALILLGTGILYLVFICLKARKLNFGKNQVDIIPESGKLPKTYPIAITFILIGGILLPVGASLLVRSSIEMAVRLGVSDLVIGFTIVAAGTSLPELSASLAAAIQKHGDLCAGNIVGSNLLNLLLVGGGVGVVHPLAVEKKLFYFELPVLLIFSALLWLIFFTDRKVTRAEGVFLLLLYFIVIAVGVCHQVGFLNGLVLG